MTLIEFRLRLIAATQVFALLATPFAADAEPAKPAGFRFQTVFKQSLGLWENDQPVFVYNHGPIAKADAPGTRPRACYFHPVYGLDGEVLTDDFPKDHRYHRGMYWAWPHVQIAGQEYELWSDRGELRQVFSRWLAQEVDAGVAKLGIENGWFAGERQLVREHVWVTVHPVKDGGRALDVELTWTPLDQPLTLSGAEGKSYGGFNFRFAPRMKTVITVPENTSLPEGVTARAGQVSGDLLVTRLPWADFVGDFGRDGALSGAAIFVHPRHRDFPPTWMTRHYGLVSVGWPGVEPQTFPAKEPITCRYRVWVHRGAPSVAEIQKTYDGYQAGLEFVPAKS